MKTYCRSYWYADRVTAASQSGDLMMLVEGRIIVCTVLHTTARPPRDQCIYMVLESMLGQGHVDDVIIYYIKTHRSHPDVSCDNPETTCLHLVCREAGIEVLSARTLLHRPWIVEEAMRYVFLTDVVNVLSNEVYHAAMSD